MPEDSYETPVYQCGDDRDKCLSRASSESEEMIRHALYWLCLLKA